MGRSVVLYFRGPVATVGGALSFLLAAVAVAQLVRGESVWMWLCFALLALVAVSFYKFHQVQVEARERAEALPNQVEELISEGMKLLDDMSGPMSPPYPLAPDAKRLDEGFDFFERARQLVIAAGRPSLLLDLDRGIRKVRERDREKRERQDQQEEERQRRGEKVTDAEKLKRWAEMMHKRPAMMMEAYLEGLAEVRKSLP